MPSKKKKRTSNDCEVEEEEDLKTKKKNNEDDGGMKRVKEHFTALAKRKTKQQAKKTNSLFSELQPPLQVKGNAFRLEKHKEEKEALIIFHTKKFEQWWWEMENGFSILLQGYGSKALVLDMFASCVSKLINANSFGLGKRSVEPLVCTVRGWSKDVDIRKLVESLMREWLEWDTTRIASEKRKSGGDWTIEDRCAAVIRDAESTRRCLVLIVHSLDAEGLRTKSSQQALSCLAASRNIRFIASIDHINSPLMWSRRDWKRFNFVGHDASTFVPYTLETSFFSHPTVSAQTVASVSSSRGIAYVLKSLTPTHIKILKWLGTEQLKLGGDDVEFQALFQHCLGMMWVASIAVLNQYMKEFQDHDLVKSKTVDGRQYLKICAPAKVIRRDILGDDDEEEEEENN